jgi:hypothetical protein
VWWSPDTAGNCTIRTDGEFPYFDDPHLVIWASCGIEITALSFPKMS